MSYKSIFLSLSPNVEKDDLALDLKLLFAPWLWKKGGKVKELEGKTQQYLGLKHTFAFNSGRSAFLAVLNGLNLEKNSEVLVQGFTCNALINPIIWFGLKPVYVDIEEKTLNMDPADLRRKITENSRAVVVQHTFGQPADLEEIKKICENRNLILVEDCAHSLGAEFQGRKVGGFGKASFFSFGRDKIISSVYGGMAATNDEELAWRIKDYRDKLSLPSLFWIKQQLLHPILCEKIVKPLYRFFGFGRWVLAGLNRIGVLSKAVHKREKYKGEKPPYIPRKMPNGLAFLALNQLQKIEKLLKHQKQIAGFYDREVEGVEKPLKNEGRVYMRYSVLVNGFDTDEVLKKARLQRIFLDDGWRKTPVVPYDTDHQKMQYHWGDCPTAERVARKIINLPTNIQVSEKEAQKVASFLNNIINES